MLSKESVQVCKVYNGSVAGTKIEVTDNPNVLIFSITVTNETAALAYLQIYDADSADVTVGTTTPDLTFGVGQTGDHLHMYFPKPIKLTSGFTIASTTTRTGSAAAQQEVSITYMDEA